MSASLSLLTLRSTLDREGKKVEEIQEELLLDLEDGKGTQFLSGTCYGEAVRECRRIGEDQYVLEVRPDMRMLLHRQLREHYKVYRVFRFKGETGSRAVFTGEVLLRFRPSTFGHERCSTIKNHVAKPQRFAEPRDGFYDLADHLRETPVAASISLELDPVIERASPVICILPDGVPQSGESVDLKVV